MGAASTSHKAIHKLLAEIEDAGIDVHGVKKATKGNPESVYDGPNITSDDDREACLGPPLSGGTAWLDQCGAARMALDAWLQGKPPDEVEQLLSRIALRSSFGPLRLSLTATSGFRRPAGRAVGGPGATAPAA